MKIRVVIIDDELPARIRLNNYLKDYKDIHVIGEAECGKEAINLINKEKPDLIFLDIQMPIIDGFKILENITHIPKIIFVTAYDEYAIKAFEINAMDYLLKPYSKKRFSKAVNRAIEALGNKKEQKEEIVSLINEIQKKNMFLKRITVKADYEYMVVNIEDIDFFRVENGLVFVYQKENKYIIDCSLSHLEKKLDPEIFYRAHRNSIVNLKNVEKVDIWGHEKYVAKFEGNQKVYISREKIKEFKKIMGLKV